MGFFSKKAINVNITRFKADRNKGENIRSTDEVSPLVFDGFRHGNLSGNMKTVEKRGTSVQYVEKLKKILVKG